DRTGGGTAAGRDVTGQGGRKGGEASSRREQKTTPPPDVVRAGQRTQLVNRVNESGHSEGEFLGRHTRSLDHALIIFDCEVVEERADLRIVQGSVRGGLVGIEGRLVCVLLLHDVGGGVGAGSE